MASLPESTEEKSTIEIMKEELKETGTSIASAGGTPNSDEDRFVREAIAADPSSSLLPEFSFQTNPLSTENSQETPSGQFEDLPQGLQSSGQLFTTALNGQLAGANPPQQPVIQTQTRTVNDVQDNARQSAMGAEACPTPSLNTVIGAVPRTLPDPSLRRPHIMFSYKRSSVERCRPIRNELRRQRYVVWMDVYDMHDNFIDGMALAVQDSYIALIFVTQDYLKSIWCRKEMEDIAKRGIKAIPCYLEPPDNFETEFETNPWLTFLLGANVNVDFSDPANFNQSFQALLNEINAAERRLAINPRQTPPTTPTADFSATLPPQPAEPIVLNSTSTSDAQFEVIVQAFRQWVEKNRQNLRRTDRTQVIKLIMDLLQSLRDDRILPNGGDKDELLREIFRIISENPSPSVSSTFSPSVLIKSYLVVMGLWATKVIFQ